ncbi:MAG: hypothetical protein AB7E05_07980 [Sphingobium sp.]
MSEFSPYPRGRPDGERWPPSPALLGAGRQRARGLSLVMERCFDGTDARWSDALIARMRRHIGGCVNAIEPLVRAELRRFAPADAAMIDVLPGPVAWNALGQRPSLMGERLIRHFRDRAAISLMEQDEQAGMAADHRAGDGKDAETLFPAGVAAGLAALAKAREGWADGQPDECPMQADLPAEDMEELLWVIVALIVDALVLAGAIPVAQALQLGDRAGRAVLARHDEQTAPFAQALLLAHRMRGIGMEDAHLLWLARNRHVLVQLAVMADRTGIDHAHLVGRVVEGPEYLLFQLCRRADFPREVAVRLMLGRRSVSRGVEDTVLVEYADGYERMSPDDAALATAALGISACFRDKLSALRNGPPGS